MKNIKKKIHLIVHNQEEKVAKTVRSIQKQTNQEFHMHWIDNGVNTRSMLSDLEHMDYKASKTTESPLYRFYTEIHALEDDAIVLLMHGGDQLAHERVIDEIQDLYRSRNVWLNYGGFVDYPSYKHEKTEIPLLSLIQRDYTEFFWHTGHLLGFYAALFKRVCLFDLIEEGMFKKQGYELAILLPMLEMAEEKAHAIKEPLYLGKKRDKITEKQVKQYLLSRRAYSPLDNFPHSC